MLALWKVAASVLTRTAKTLFAQTNVPVTNPRRPHTSAPANARLVANAQTKLARKTHAKTNVKDITFAKAFVLFAANA